MSYFCFMACSRRLELDHCNKRFLTVYPSYAEYMRSENYRFRKYRAFNEPLNAKGPVYFYSKMCEAPEPPMFPFPPLSSCNEEYRSVAVLFSQPYLYRLYDCDPEYLCRHLLPGDKLEYLSIFLGHDEPMRQPVVGTIDLQDYLEFRQSDKDISQKICTPPENNLTHFIPARYPGDYPYPYPSGDSDAVCVIFGDTASEWWDTEKLRSQSLL